MRPNLPWEKHEAYVYKKDFTKLTTTSFSLASVSLDNAPSLLIVSISPDSLLLRWARKSVWLLARTPIPFRPYIEIHTLFELANPANWDAVKVTVYTSIDQRNLLLNGHRGVLLLPLMVLESYGT
jgi:hypothetical protein